MKTSEIFKGQVYETKMLGRFTSETKVLSPIEVLANVEGFIIFKRDGIKEAFHDKYFISTFIKACKYRLKSKDFEYNGYIVVWDDGVYNIGNPVSCCAMTAEDARAKIDEFDNCEKY
jgi:hypothetical protein